MYDLALALYAYVVERDGETRFIDDLSAYRAGKRCSDSAYEKLLPLLDKDADTLLDRFLSERSIVEAMERESLFTAGVAVGLSLSRLG